MPLRRDTHRLPPNRELLSHPPPASPDHTDKQLDTTRHYDIASNAQYENAIGARCRPNYTPIA
jgi:hypothetical protein